MTLRTHKQRLETQISLYKAYLLNRGIDAKHRTIAWAITERDELDDDNLITEIARLGEEVKELRIRAICDPAYLDEPLEYYIEEIEANLNKTEVHVPAY